MSLPAISKHFKVLEDAALIARSRDAQWRPSLRCVVKNERLVFTNAYTKAWEPSEKPFMTVILTFENESGKTKYTARVLHWPVADREAHEKMGFHQGWGQCTDQLVALVRKS